MGKLNKAAFQIVCGWMLLVFLIFVTICLGIGGLLDAAFQIVCGWALFLWRVLPRTSINWASTITALVCMVGLAVGLHYFLRWLHAQVRKARGQEGATWRWRWTGMLLALVLVTFLAGTSAVGMVHQTSWLLAQPEGVFHVTGGMREVVARMSSANNLKQMGVAVHLYAQAQQDTMPPGGTFDAAGNALHSWETLLLPYLEHDHLYRRIDREVSWHHPRNAPVVRTKVVPFLSSTVKEQEDEEGFALSHYAANVRVIGGNQARNLASITDGLSNTILAGEVWSHYRPWADPINWRDPGRGIHTTPDSFGTPHRKDRVQFLMADGSVRSLDKDIKPEVLKALSTPDGGEKVAEDGW